LTLRSAALLTAIIACGLGSYQYYETNIKQKTVFYPVADLISGRPEQRMRNRDDFAALVASIRSEVSHGSWKGQGGSGAITEFLLNDSLIVRTNEFTHNRIAAFLRETRTLRENMLVHALRLPLNVVSP
jgi:hypothetical protein